ncbi:hypothetical protein [Pseudomonas serbica]|uniref:hypothetical protein n=1 Tax=Pseudomonas serbica TaxID=2965074 RepID=UPI00237B9102|nr:hypothetical protein [Pseudomonas serbica]
MLIYTMLFVGLALALHLQKIQNKFYTVKYTCSVIICLCGSLILLAVNGSEITTDSFDFLTDYRFYLAQVFNIVMLMVQVEGRKQNEKNMEVFYFSSFLIISAIPILTPLLTDVFNFKYAVVETYSSPYSKYALVGCMLVLSFLFYARKLRNKTCHRPDLLVANIVFGSVAIILGGRLVQEYNAINYLIAASVFTAISFLGLALFNGEHKRIRDANLQIRPISEIVFCFVVSLYISSYVIKHSTIETYTIIRSVGFIFVSYAYSWIVEKQKTHNLRDAVLLGLMIISLFVFSG